jgi:hypothetical protein
MVAIGFLLAIWIPYFIAFGIVALVNLAAGAFLSGIWGRRALKQRIALERTGEELQRDKRWLQSLKRGEQHLPPPEPTVVAQPHSRAVPAGKEGDTGGPTGSLGPRSPEPRRGQPEAGATTPPEGMH